MTKRNQNVECWEGEYHTLPFSVVDASAAAVNITGASLTWKMCSDGPSGTVILTKTIGSGITVVSASGGTATISLAETDTVNLGGTTYYHELVVEDSAGHSEVGFVGVITINKSGIL